MATSADYSDEDDYETVFLPCEFCTEQYPMELLAEHQSGCRPDLLHFKEENQIPKSGMDMQKKPARQKPAEFLAEIMSNNNERTTQYYTEGSDWAVKNQSKLPSKGQKHSKIQINVDKEFKYDDEDEVVDPLCNLNLLRNSDKECEDSAVDRQRDIEDDCVLSDAEDDDPESLECFWRKANLILKKRLATENQDNFQKNNNRNDKNNILNKKFEFKVNNSKAPFSGRW